VKSPSGIYNANLYTDEKNAKNRNSPADQKPAETPQDAPLHQSASFSEHLHQLKKKFRKNKPYFQYPEEAL